MAEPTLYKLLSGLKGVFVRPVVPETLTMAVPDKFRFRKLDMIGAADAEEDSSFLAHCYVNTGYLQALKDCENPRRIIVGRTGSGKTALLKRLVSAEERTIEVRPESLALSY